MAQNGRKQMNRYWPLALSLLAATQIAEAGPKPIVLKADEVRQTLIGNVITDGAHWRYHLKPDGSIDGFEMGRVRKGRWNIRGDKLCLVIAAGASPNECWDVMREGRNLVLGINGNAIRDIQVE